MIKAPADLLSGDTLSTDDTFSVFLHGGRGGSSLGPLL